MTHPAGVVAVPHGEFTRFGGFTHSLACFHYPPGTRIKMRGSVSIAQNLNYIVAHSLTQEGECEWVWFQADDHIFYPDALMRLLDRNVDVVVPLIARRSPPFTPVLYKNLTDNGYEPYRWEELPKSGLQEVFACGSAGMLVRRGVFEAITELQGHGRFFEYDQGDRANEDLVFCRKVRDAGFKIYADCEVSMGHRGMFTAWPIRGQEGGLCVSVELGTNPTGRPHNLIFVDPEFEVT